MVYDPDKNLNLMEVSALDREDALCHKLMLMFGLDGGYDEWLNTYLEKEDPLSDIVLELAGCGSDINKTITVLDRFCGEAPIDERAVCERLRLFLRDAYYANRVSKEEIASTIYCLARNVGDPEDYNVDVWGGAYALDDYYDLAKSGIISWEQFDAVFFDFLNNGAPVDPNRIWDERKQRLRWFDRIKKILFGTK